MLQAARMKQWNYWQRNSTLLFCSLPVQRVLWSDDDGLQTIPDSRESHAANRPTGIGKEREGD